jgi:polyisoprenoid-binding protein YceI
MRISVLSAATFAALSLVASTPASAAATTYSIDPVHSYLIFRVKHMDAGYAYGRFNTFSGTITLDEAAPASCAVKMEVDVGSVDTGVENRDKHLKSPDFFNAAQFPKMTFESTAVKKAGDDYEVTGNLTLHGVTKPVTVKMTKTGQGSMRGKTIVGFEGTLEIKRTDFGVGKPPPGLADEVKMTISVEASPQ